jgi:hypothetical protein
VSGLRCTGEVLRLHLNEAQRQLQLASTLASQTPGYVLQFQALENHAGANARTLSQCKDYLVEVQVYHARNSHLLEGPPPKMPPMVTHAKQHKQCIVMHLIGCTITYTILVDMSDVIVFMLRNSLPHHLLIIFPCGHVVGLCIEHVHYMCAQTACTLQVESPRSESSWRARCSSTLGHARVGGM